MTSHMLGCCINKKYGYEHGCTDETCMQLPEGETCGSCVHARRCTMMFGAEVSNDYCQFFPRRFRSGEDGSEVR